jgi:hypothetical protein
MPKWRRIRATTIGAHRPGVSTIRGEYGDHSAGVGVSKATEIAISALFMGSRALEYTGVPGTVTWGGEKWTFHGDNRDPSYYTRGAALKIIRTLRGQGYIAKAFQPTPRGKGLFEVGLVIYKRKRRS